MIWLINAVNGKVMASFAGHEDEVNCAYFTLEDKNKHIVSASADKTVRVWSPMQASCIQTLRAGKTLFHQSSILCIALHHDKPVVLSGDSDGKVFASQYMTG